MGSWPCKSSGVMIIDLMYWRTGRQSPIECEPSASGNISIDEHGCYYILTKTALWDARIAGEDLHQNHFATCPAATEWYKT